MLALIQFPELSAVRTSWRTDSSVTPLSCLLSLSNLVLGQFFSSVRFGRPGRWFAFVPGRLTFLKSGGFSSHQEFLFLFFCSFVPSFLGRPSEILFLRFRKSISYFSTAWYMSFGMVHSSMTRLAKSEAVIRIVYKIRSFFSRSNVRNFELFERIAVLTSSFGSSKYSGSQCDPLFLFCGVRMKRIYVFHT